MARRKAKKILKKRPQPKLAKEFDCPCCGNSKSVNANLDKKRQTGYLACRLCGASYSSSINKLTESIDLYSEWIDACVEVNEPQQPPVYQLPERESKRQFLSKIRESEENEEDDEEYNPSEDENIAVRPSKVAKHSAFNATIAGDDEDDDWLVAA